MALGFFTKAHGQLTVEYRLDRDTLGRLFDRDPYAVPHGFCTTVANLRELANKRGVFNVIDLLNADQRSWARRIGVTPGQYPSPFENFQVCVSIQGDEFIGRPRLLDVRSHEQFHAQVANYRRQLAKDGTNEMSRRREDAVVAAVLTEAFNAARVADAAGIVQRMRDLSVERRWSSTHRNLEEALARVVGYNAVANELRLKEGVSAKDLPKRMDIVRSQYGGPVFDAFYAAVARTGRSPFSLMQEATAKTY